MINMMRKMNYNMKALCILCLLIVLFFVYRYYDNQRIHKKENDAQQSSESFCGTSSCALVH
jgi:predicted negative regulator of RcsB-dependent stress response